MRAGSPSANQVRVDTEMRPELAFGWRGEETVDSEVPDADVVGNSVVPAGSEEKFSRDALVVLGDAMMYVVPRLVEA